MKRWLWFGVGFLLGALVLAALPCGAQTQQAFNPAPLPLYAPWITDTLAVRYRTTQIDSLSVEYLACLRYRASRFTDQAAVYVLDSIRFPEQQGIVVRDITGKIVNYTFSSRVACEPNEILLHTHSQWQQQALGNPHDPNDPWWRYPSDADNLILRIDKAPFAIIQYSDTGLAEYYPDSIDAEILDRVFNGTRTGWQLSTGQYASILAGGVWANVLFKIDRDDGNGPDEWMAQDKLLHSTIAFGMTGAAMTAGVEGWHAAVGVCVAGAAYEWSQGHISERDIVANCTGAGLAWAWGALWR